MNQDLEYLRLLSIFHYIVAGITSLFSLFPVIHLVIGIAMVTGHFDVRKDPVAGMMGWVFIVFAIMIIILGLSYSVCLAMSGRFLARRTHYLYCLVMAGLSCMFVPFGTVLGVFTIVVLVRDSVRQLFQLKPVGEVMHTPGQ